MGIRSALAYLAWIAATAIGAFQNPQTPIEPRSGRLVIDAVVLDRAGLPVVDVKPSELEVWIAGYRVPIDAVTFVNPTEGVPSSRTIALLLDDINVDPAVMPRVREAARRFVIKMIPNDRMAIVTLSGSMLGANADRARLLQHIDAYAPHAWTVDRLDTKGAHILNSVAAVSQLIGGVTDRRKAIVALGPAVLFDTPIPPPTLGRDLRSEWVNAMRAMAAANVALYVIDPSGVGGSPTTGGDSGFARETGGMAFTNTNDMSRVADRILRETGSYYLLDIADPPMGRQMDVRSLDVRVLRPGLSVRARRAVPGAR